MSTFGKREKEAEKTKPSTALLSCLYVAVIAVGSFLIAGYVMSQVNLYQTLGLSSLEVPVINVPGTDIPQWALQLALAAFIFLLVQPLVVFLVSLVSRRSGDDEVALQTTQCVVALAFLSSPSLFQE